jgi:nucleotide-binding universal stress UspA family protein
MRFPPQSVLSAIDFSDFTNTVLEHSVALCKKYSARLLLVHVTIDANTLLEHNETSLDVNALQEENIRYAEKALAELANGVDVECNTIVGKGSPADEISRMASEQKADVVVTATHGRSGFKRLLIGSVTEKLLRTLSCPMLILHAREQAAAGPTGLGSNIKKVLVGCDFSPDSTLAIDYGVNLAQSFQAELHLSHVIKPSLYTATLQESKDLRGRLSQQLERLAPEGRRGGRTVHTVVLEGEPYLELMNYARQQDIDMIVLGIRGHTLWEKLLVGSTTDRLVRHTRVPVLAVRQLQEQVTG